METFWVFCFTFSVVAYASEDFFHPRVLFSQENVPNAEMQDGFWWNKARDELKYNLKKRINENVAKNVIMFLGDGMSIPTLTAARLLLGGEEKQLSFEKFPFVGLSKTYCVDSQTADSACSATAYLCGIKANSGTIGVTSNVTRYNCEQMADKRNHVSSIAQWAQEAGKATGIITTTRVTHASPSGTFAHIADRHWEADSDIKESGFDPKICPDITEQLVNHNPGKNFNVILGCGRKTFLPVYEIDEEGGNGTRLDHRNMIDEWMKNKEGRSDKAHYVWNKKQLESIDALKTDYLLGLFENDHCKFHLDVVEEGVEDQEPSLADMLSKALEVLSKEKKGYFLFVEGGKIDHAHHFTQPRKALDETVEFSKAIELAVSKTSEDDTLIVVTSDHSHTMSLSGYPKRGNDIFGTVGIADDGLPMATLNYANGPGYAKHINENGGRKNYHQAVDTKQNDFVSPSIAPVFLEHHGGDDVGVFALGPWAHLFTGNYEQNTIPHLMAYASCIGRSYKADACYLNK